MENAAKALLIGAGFLLALMLISMLMMGYNRISTHYEQKHEILTAEQLDKFNKQFQNYKRSDIRGNELISLMNKVIDYNASQSYQEGTGYEPIKVEIDMISNNIIDQYFKHNPADDSIFNVDANCKITNTAGPSYSNDRRLAEIAGTSAELIAFATRTPSLCPNSDGDMIITDTILQKLTAEIPNIKIDEDDESYRACDNRRSRAIIIRSILRWKWTRTDSGETDYDLLVHKDNYKTQSAEDGPEKIKKIKEIVSKYHQYTQFKRACFDCVEMTYNTETGRINGMKFRVQTKEVDGVTSVVFN